MGTTDARHLGPLALMPLIGREPDVRHLDRLLSQHRLTTVVGAGGIGKTAICAHVAEALRGLGSDVVWVDLTPIGADDDVIPAIAHAVSDGSPPADRDAVVDALVARGDVVLVLDNCEHVIASVVPIVAELLRAGSAIRVLATSRLQLDIPGEVTWRLGPLPNPPNDVPVTPADLSSYGATALFVERAGQVLPAFRIDANDAAQITALCRWLDGNPLAVLIAASQVRSLSLADLGASLRRSNRLLKVGAHAGGGLDVDASIAWSFDLLDERTRRLLRMLAAIPGDFELDLACRVAGEPIDDEVIAGVARLVDHGLAEFDGRSRYRLTFVVRHFLTALPDPDGDLAAAGERHARGTIDWATDQTRWGTAVRPGALDERATDVHAAIGWAMVHDPELACRAFADFGIMLHGAMHVRYFAWLTEQRRRGPMWARAIGWLAILAPPSAYEAIGGVMPEALAIATSAGDQHALRLLACTPTYAALIALDLRPARTLTSDAIAADDGWIVVAVATTGAMFAAAMGRRADADEFRRAVAWACERGGLDARSTAGTIADAIVLHNEGALAEAEELLDSVIDHGQVGVSRLYVRTLLAIERADADALRDVIGAIGTSDDLGEQMVARHAALGLQGLAGAWADAARSAFDLLGRGAVWDVELTLFRAAALANAGDRDAADDALADVAVRVGELPEQSPIYESRLSLLHARAAILGGEVDRAQQHAMDALALAREHSLRLVQIDAVQVCALVAAARGNVRLAGRLLGASVAAREATGCMGQAFAGPSADVGDAASRAEGRLLSLPDAIALALRMRGARRRPPFGTGSLTPTERSVALLVAAGRTNAEIAAEMLISIATVKTHLTHAFAKLGVTNRTQLARAVDGRS